jgi:hypothetical protein
MAVATPNPYPATLSVESPEKIANWRPLVQWLLAIPHFVVLYLLEIAASVVVFVSWFAIVITGKLPAGMAAFQALYLRYGNRVVSYAGYLREEYPPFSFESAAPDPGDYAGVRSDFTPALEDRNRLTTFFRLLLAIPHLVVLVFVGLAAWIAWLLAFFAVLFTGKWPAGLHRFVVGYLRWSLRVNAYFFLLTDEYPPFSLD